MHPYFGRTELLIGEDGLRRLQGARVAIFGLGGVGSFAAEALTRSGVGSLRLVDFDRVGPSNFNRQLYALHSTLGQPKVQVAAARLVDINPDLQIDARERFFHADSADELLAMPLDFVIDAIDSLGPKCELLAQCLTRGIPIIAAMGAAARTDPSALRVGTIWDTRGCPLARKVRHDLRRRGITAPLPVVYSSEPPRDTFAPESLGEQAEDYFTRGRPRRVLPSMGMLPGMVGLMAANYVVQQLVEQVLVG
ncbi:MAG TPA: tRNA threonylcarbamoyladenosine dehydratase [Armatimonadota bacterium]|jgi:tRNA A37 threonylcarbamoyladenosine dehydratase